MAEDSEAGRGPDRSGPEAAHIALNAASRTAADAYLEKNSRLVDLQIADMEREDHLRHWSLRIRHVSDVMKLTFELALALIFASVVVVIGVAVVEASRDNSLVIDAFSVPPDLAAKGITGQAVAAQLQDKLTALQDATDTARPASSFANNWGDDIKVQIPDTGVSVADFYRLLVAWLGHQTRITGEVYHSNKGLSITARVTGSGGDTAASDKDDLDWLVQKAAEAIYARTQPYRYSVYLQQKGDSAGAAIILNRLTVEGDTPRERAWAYVGLGALDNLLGDGYGAMSNVKKAVAIVPDFALAKDDIGGFASSLDQEEFALDASRKALLLLEVRGPIDMTDRARNLAIWNTHAVVDGLLWDIGAQLHDSQEASNLPDWNGGAAGALTQVPVDYALLHDDARANEAVKAMRASPLAPQKTFYDFAILNLDYSLQSWPQTLALVPQVEADFETDRKNHLYGAAFDNVTLVRFVIPVAAQAYAELGDFRQAHAFADRTPLDCYTCLWIRGVVDAREHNGHGADYWFVRATRSAPSIPMCYFEWGAALFARGDLDGAIAKFALANQKGPHFADPLEMWGEALIARNRSDLALSKFEEANKYAPNWGRLHLKWGEALLWSGDKDGATKQFALAAALDLTPSEKSERMRVTHG
jgi:tetratricopeptide (TPR) repeat protein